MIKFQSTSFEALQQNDVLNIKLNQETVFIKSKKANNLSKIPATIMSLVLHHQVMIVNKCCKFKSNSFDQSRKKVDRNTKLIKKTTISTSKRPVILTNLKLEFFKLLFLIIF